MHTGTFESNALESLMFGCPSLVWLTIAYCSGIECINICSPTFKALHVQGDQVIKSICLEKAKNMTDLSLMVDEPGDDFESDTVSNLIKGLSKIESICLGEGYIKIFSVGILPERLQRSLNCLKYLDLFGVNFNETRELLFVISLLESSPNLEKLSIESYSDGMDVGLPHTLEKSKYNSCCLTELLTVHIIVNNACKNTLNFIRFLLANSPSLEILSFKIALGQDHYSISKDEKKPLTSFLIIDFNSRTTDVKDGEVVVHEIGGGVGFGSCLRLYYWLVLLTICEWSELALCLDLKSGLAKWEGYVCWCDGVDLHLYLAFLTSSAAVFVGCW
ncbi:F-box/FBD/LRR-repeat protein [Spatholobus suberectus]|nr:F-box/FBD/LRR-repeat protein [Spatholobus suberectus]